MHKILVCGSRTFGNLKESIKQLGKGAGSKQYEDDWRICKKWLDFYFMHKLHEGIQIVHGGAFGADHLADRYAREILGQVPIVVKPDYDNHPKNIAPLLRNTVMVDMSDFVVAFWDGKSRGTKDAKDKAYQSDTVQDVKIVRFDLERLKV